MPESETILVVDDTDEIRRIVCGMLSLRGYNCLAASNGLQALDLIERGSQPVHLMLTDMIMPKMIGAELARLVAQRRPEIRIMLMSGFSQDPLVRSYRRMPAVFISKPFTAATLYAKIRQTLDQPWSGLPDVAVTIP